MNLEIPSLSAASRRAVTHLLRCASVVFGLVLLGSSMLYAQDAPQAPHVVFVTGGEEYKSTEVLEPYAQKLREDYGFKVTYIKDDAPGAGAEQEMSKTPLPQVEVIDDADLLVVFARFRTWTDRSKQLFLDHFEKGKPAIGIRTATHAFWNDRTFSPEYLGGHYKTHYHGRIVAQVNPEQANHPMVRGVQRKWGKGEGPYVSTPLTEGATPTVFSYGHNRDRDESPGIGSDSFDSPNYPVAWTFNDDGARRAMITLGSYRVGDVKADYMRKLFYNSVFWSLGYRVPQDGVLSAGPSIEMTPEEQAYTSAKNIVPAPPEFTPEDDWDMLFDGKDLSSWKHWDVSLPPYGIPLDRRAMTKGPIDYPLADARWNIQNGAVVARPGYGDIVTKDTYTNFELHLDYYLPEHPDWVTGEWRGNSGIYLYGSYEIAILDSHGQEPTARSNGAIYRQRAPNSEASRPAGQWQNMMIRVEDGTVTVELNGEVIHEEVALEAPTRYGFPTAGTYAPGSWQAEEGVRHEGPIRLQAETSRVRFANIAVRRL